MCVPVNTEWRLFDVYMASAASGMLCGMAEVNKPTGVVKSVNACLQTHSQALKWVKRLVGMEFNEVSDRFTAVGYPPPPPMKPHTPWELGIVNSSSLHIESGHTTLSPPMPVLASTRCHGGHSAFVWRGTNGDSACSPALGTNTTPHSGGTMPPRVLARIAAAGETAVRMAH